MTGKIFDIQRFSVHDGPGIRTTVFLKGCPLSCLWCHNPESKSAKSEIMLHGKKCIGCLECVRACELGLHSFTEEGEHLIRRSECTLCTKCAQACVGAIEICGKDNSAEAIIETVLKDRDFYKNSGGGMTLSGGEPLMQPEFAKELLSLAKAEGINTAIETSGYASFDAIEAIIPYTDLFLWDVKETDCERHKLYTGVSNERILENLRRLSAAGASIVLRCPIIPGYNDREEHLLAIGRLAEELDGVIRVDIEPYHPLGKSKALSVGKEYPIDDSVKSPDKDKIAEWIAKVSSVTSKKVVKS